jgi:hypothetical protein
MVTTHIKITILFLLVVGTMTVLDAVADKVVLKNGAVEETSRVWESEHYVHFVLKGTRSVEIRYSKEIVDHIEGPDGVIRSVVAKGTDAVPTPQPVPTTASSAPVSNALGKGRPSATPTTKTAAPGDTDRNKSIQLDRSLIEKNRNLTFYDPRRAQRYWADRQSKHESYAAAMGVLSKQYGHPVDWIEKFMGQENDLGAIHGSLIAAVEAETAPIQTQAEIEKSTTEPPNEKSHVANDSKDLQAGHETAQVSTPSPIKVSEGALSPIGAIASGILFYDPRRSEKYWATPKDHFTSLQEAIDLIAKLYGVPTSHIEANLGDSNDLSQIHLNIQKSLGLVQK